jgi:hypothetical protein
MRPLAFSHAPLPSVALVAMLLSLAPDAAWAGAPFVTDDPGTPDKGQVEINLSLQFTAAQGGSGGTLPGIEMNYAPAAGLQLHLFQPLAFDHVSGGGTHWGPGDTELGVKYRVLDEAADGWLPAAAFFPLVTVPSGDAERGLGSGHVRAFLPLWLGRTFGDWTAFGGGGYSINPGAGNKNFWFTGVGLLRKVSDALSLGGEVFHTTADAVGGVDATGFNLGGSYSITETQAILLSMGRSLQHANATNRLSAFLAYHIVF